MEVGSGVDHFERDQASRSNTGHLGNFHAFPVPG
jgi:hypothetical protein